MSASHINVAVRVRPLSERELAAGSVASWRIGARALTQLDPATGAPIAAQTYAFGA